MVFWGSCVCLVVLCLAGFRCVCVCVCVCVCACVCLCVCVCVRVCVRAGVRHFLLLCGFELCISSHSRGLPIVCVQGVPILLTLYYRSYSVDCCFPSTTIRFYIIMTIFYDYCTIKFLYDYRNLDCPVRLLLSFNLNFCTCIKFYK